LKFVGAASDWMLQAGDAMAATAAGAETRARTAAQAATAAKPWSGLDDLEPGAEPGDRRLPILERQRRLIRRRGSFGADKGLATRRGFTDRSPSSPPRLSAGGFRMER
jgi:hypothetical protein